MCKKEKYYGYKSSTNFIHAFLGRRPIVMNCKSSTLLVIVIFFKLYLPCLFGAIGVSIHVNQNKKATVAENAAVKIVGGCRKFNFFGPKDVLAIPLYEYNQGTQFAGLEVWNVDEQNGFTKRGRIDHAPARKWRGSSFRTTRPFPRCAPRT